MTLREAAALALREIDRRRLLVGLPLGLSRLIAGSTEFASKATFGLFPKLLTTTRDQVDLLASDNVVSAEAEAEGRDLARARRPAAGRRGDHSVLSDPVSPHGPVRGSTFGLSGAGLAQAGARRTGSSARNIEGLLLMQAAISGHEERRNAGIVSSGDDP